MATELIGYPASAQTEYARFPKAPLTGSLWEGELWNERPASVVIAAVTPVAYSATVTIGANNPTDTVGVTINGGLVIVTAGADADATAALLGPAILAAAFTDDLIVTAVVATNVVTPVGKLNKSVSTVEYSPDTTTATVVETPAVVQAELCYGMGVVRDVVSTTLNYGKVLKPSSLTDVFAGVLIRTQGSDIPAGQKLDFDATLNPDALMPGQAYTAARENVGVMVEFAGADPTEVDDVYLIMTGSDAGWWASSSGAVQKVVTLTAVSVADGNIGFDYDGLTALSVTATASIINDSASLFALLIADSAYRALFADYTTDAVDNLDGTMTLTFAEGLEPVFADASTGTSTMSEGLVTAAVAANAVLHPAYSWGRPSIAAADDTPARAFLRLSNP